MSNMNHLIASPSCAICTAASALVQTGVNPRESRIPQSMSHQAVQLGTIKEYTESAATCPLCRTLLAHLDLLAQSNNKQWRFADDDVIEMAYIVFMGMWEVLASPNEKKSSLRNRGPHAQMRFIRHVHVPEPTACEREMLALVPPEEGHTGLGPGVDFSRIRKWIEYCDTNHRGTCFAIEDPWKKVDPPGHLYFIDVEDECLSWQPGHVKYLALSYVWGTDPEPLVSRLGNIGLLRQPGSLTESSALGNRLPRTLRDAMTVARELATRYLWVDRLCIIQDDPIQKPAQLAAMASIYSNASITLIAATGTDTHGLFSSPPTPSVIHLPPSLSLLHDSPTPLLQPPSKPTPASYSRRAWTLQEELLSPRILKFSPAEPTFLCRRSRFRSVFHDAPQLYDNRTATGIEIQLFKPLPDVSTYAHLAEEYTRRFLTYDTDAVDAFSAIISAYSRALPGGMLFGLPEVLFEGALLWQFSSGGTVPPLRRREGGAAPSWSFLGWQGEGLGMKAWVELFLNTMKSRPASEAKRVYFHSRVQVVRCVEFWKVDRATGERVRVGSGYAEEEEARERRKDYEGIESHVEILREPAVVEMGTWETELVVKTRRAEALVGGGLPLSGCGQDSSGSDSGGRDIALLSADNQIIGAIRPGANVPAPGTAIPLILLSMGIASSPPISWEMPELNVFHAQCPQKEWCSRTWSMCSDHVKERYVPYEFYNVMWVGWRDDGRGRRVAYREGLGRVEKKVWDGMKTEEVEILLG